MDGDEDGKINGKFPIFDDLLAFLWSKMNVSPRDTLLNVLKTFYKPDDIAKSRDLLFRKLPDSTTRRVKHRKTEDILKGMYELMQSVPTEDPPSFVAVDLNNIPFINLSNIDGAVLVSQQSVLKTEFTALLDEQKEMRLQLSSIKELLEMNGLRNSTSAAAAGSGDTPRSQNTPANDNLRTSASEPTTASRATPAITAGPEVSGDMRSYSAAASHGGRARAQATTSRGGGRRVTRTTSQGGGRPAGRITSRDRGAGRSPATLAEGAARGPSNNGYSNNTEDIDDEGDFTLVSNRRRGRRPVVVGSKDGTNLRSVIQVKNVRVFISRLEANISIATIKEYVDNMIGDECKVERLKTKYDSYSSFLVTCGLRYKDTVMNPEEWQVGVLIRPFFGQPRADTVLEALPITSPSHNE